MQIQGGRWVTFGMKMVEEKVCGMQESNLLSQRFCGEEVDDVLKRKWERGGNRFGCKVKDCVIHENTGR